MAAHRRFDIEELTNRPGTYFNPLTEVMIVVDDTPDLDHEIFAGEEFEDNEWVLISEESPLDEHRRDVLIERFQVAFHQGGERSADEDLEDEEEELEPDEDEVEEL
jgi:hypothetical protein